MSLLSTSLGNSSHIGWHLEYNRSIAQVILQIRKVDRAIPFTKGARVDRNACQLQQLVYSDVAFSMSKKDWWGKVRIEGLPFLTHISEGALIF